MAETLTVSLLDRPVTTKGDASGLIPWLREALVPPFDEGDDPGDGVEVIVGSRTEPDDEPLGPATPWPGYALGERLVWLPGRRTDSAVVVDDEHFGVRLQVQPGRVEIRALGPAPRIRPAAFRVVRELAVSPRSSEGRLELHAAAIELDGRIIAFAGPKRAGKTTTLAHIVMSEDAGIVTNDRLLLTARGTEIQARGIPTFVSVRPDTATRLNAAFGGVDSRAHRLDSSIAELRALPRAPSAEVAGHGFTPAQFAEVLGSRLHAGGPLACVAFLRVDPAVETSSVVRLRGPELERRYEECVRAGDDASIPTIFDRCLGRESLSMPDTSFRSRLVETLPSFDVRVGDGFLDDGRTARELTARLLEASTQP